MKTIDDWCLKAHPNFKVQAARLTEDNASEVAEWCGGDLIEEIDPEHPEEMQPGINVRTQTGFARASLHMYVVKIGGSFYVAHNRVFENRYEPVKGEAPPLESIGDTRKRLGFADPFAPPGAH